MLYVCRWSGPMLLQYYPCNIPTTTTSAHTTTTSAHHTIDSTRTTILLRPHYIKLPPPTQQKTNTKPTNHNTPNNKLFLYNYPPTPYTNPLPHHHSLPISSYTSHTTSISPHSTILLRPHYHLTPPILPSYSSLPPPTPPLLQVTPPTKQLTCCVSS